MYIFIVFSHTKIRKEDECMQIVQKIALVFTIIGAVNWGLIGLFDFNLVNMLFGEIEMLEKIIYIFVGICGLINIGILFTELYQGEH